MAQREVEKLETAVLALQRIRDYGHTPACKNSLKFSDGYGCRCQPQGQDEIAIDALAVLALP